MQARLGEQLSCPQNNYPGHRIVKGVSYVLLYGAVCIFLLFMDLCNSQEFTGIFRVSFTILISSFPSKQTQIFGLRQSSYASFPLVIFFRWTLFFYFCFFPKCEASYKYSPTASGESSPAWVPHCLSLGCLRATHNESTWYSAVNIGSGFLKGIQNLVFVEWGYYRELWIAVNPNWFGPSCMPLGDAKSFPPLSPPPLQHHH